MKDNHQPHSGPQPEALPVTDDTTPVATPEVNPPVIPVNEAVATPDVNPSVAPVNEAPESAPAPSAPDLSLWELMRADLPDTPADDSSKILSNPRPSIWDLP